jgi:hypothetical protein
MLYLAQARQVITAVRGNQARGEGQAPLARKQPPGDDGA